MKKILLLGEAPGEEEEQQGKPFIGASGRLLRERLLPISGLDAASCWITNVFTQRPMNNDIEPWTATKTELKKLGYTPPLGPIHKRRFLLPQYMPMVEETQAWISQLRPDLVICLGAKAQWALTGDSRIGMFRGNLFNYELPSGWKGRAISTYHPAAVLRQWDFLPSVWADLKKAKAFLDGTEKPPVKRRIYFNPTEDELSLVHSSFLLDPAEPIGVDVETSPKIDQITVIGFSSATLGICIPFWDKGYGAKPGSVGTPAEEVAAWRWAKRFCKLPNPKVWQNGMYDSQYMLDAPLPLVLAGATHDTVLMHHSLQPELPKSLGHLASIYLNEPGWKQMRTSEKDAKAED